MRAFLSRSRVGKRRVELWSDRLGFEAGYVEIRCAGRMCYA